jgi:hypothetical protein
MKTMLLAISMLTMASTVVLADPYRLYRPNDRQFARQDIQAAKRARAELAADRVAVERAAQQAIRNGN